MPRKCERRARLSILSRTVQLWLRSEILLACQTLVIRSLHAVCLTSSRLHSLEARILVLYSVGLSLAPTIVRNPELARTTFKSSCGRDLHDEVLRSPKLG
jgi:hypothetical protein